MHVNFTFVIGNGFGLAYTRKEVTRIPNLYYIIKAY